MTLEQYYKLLETHDWYFPFTDDAKVYRKGSANETKLIKLTEDNEQYKKLFRDFANHNYSGKAWGNKQAPKPKLKDYLG